MSESDQFWKTKRMRTHTHTHTHNHMNTWTLIYTQIHTQTHTHIRACTQKTHACTRACARVHPHTQSVLSWSDFRVCGTTCRTMSKRLDPSSCLSRYLKGSYLVNLSKYRLFLNFVTVPLTLFDLFVVKYDAKCPTSSNNTPVFTCIQCMECSEK